MVHFRRFFHLGRDLLFCEVALLRALHPDHLAGQAVGKLGEGRFLRERNH